MGQHGPLRGLDVGSQDWPAALLAGQLLALLGADVRAASDAALLAPGARVSARPASVRADWDHSGLAPLTGRAGGPELRPDGFPATFGRACGLALELLSTLAGEPVRVGGARLLAQRAQALGLRRGGPVSAGGAARLLRAADGWCALSLPRPEDRELVPALISASASEPWAAAAHWAASRAVAEVEQRAALLGLAAGGLPDRPGDRTPAGDPPPWRLRPALPAPGAATAGRSRLAVNLGSLWAAPLCAHLLAQAGFHVIDVESPDRPDGSRTGTPGFYRMLHAGHERAVIPLGTAAGRAELALLLRTADVIITGSRGAALERLGATPAAVAAARDQVWVSITGYGLDSDRVAFGDDAAVAGGLVARDRAGPVFAGDAIADPLTGLAAAVAALACVIGGGSWQVSLAMRDVAAFTTDR